ncbi:MAG: TetR/AcrR family transcriptional regulator [Chloroflexaceae bacterium]|nr:TetR/AcrR family transcriptional regulator [Chloroflexaceae bacterium]
MPKPPGRTEKGERMRETILAAALDLFTTRGYHETTMRDIAAAAGCSPGLSYRYFARKEDLVLAMYAQLAGEFNTTIDALPAAPLVARFSAMMRARFEQVRPYRGVYQAILGSALNPQNELGILGAASAPLRAHVIHDNFAALVRDATDAPPERQVDALALVLYAAHLGLLLFWLCDPTPGFRATETLVRLGEQGLRFGRRLLRLPPIAHA